MTGEIASLTDTDAGMAQFHNESEARYVATKPMEIDMQGISLWPVQIDVQNETRLNGMDTSLDNVPLIGWITKSLARSQYDKNLSAATEEMKQKIVAQATERIDTEVRKRFNDVVERLNQRVFDPLNSLALDPQLIDAQTTAARLTMRLRVGGEDQLGSHTPRPPSLSDSLASVQIHESVLNNGIGRLHFDGRTFTLTELFAARRGEPQLPRPLADQPRERGRADHLRQAKLRGDSLSGRPGLALAGDRPVVQRDVVPLEQFRSAGELPAGGTRPLGPTGAQQRDSTAGQAEHGIADDPPRRFRSRPVEKDPVGPRSAENYRRAETTGHGDHAVYDSRTAGSACRSAPSRLPRAPHAIRNAMSEAIGMTPLSLWERGRVRAHLSPRWGRHSCLPRERTTHLADKNVCPTGHCVAA